MGTRRQAGDRRAQRVPNFEMGTRGQADVMMRRNVGERMKVDAPPKDDTRGGDRNVHTRAREADDLHIDVDLWGPFMRMVKGKPWIRTRVHERSTLGAREGAQGG